MSSMKAEVYKVVDAGGDILGRGSWLWCVYVQAAAEQMGLDSRIRRVTDDSAKREEEVES